ncbi:hypothetical protein PR003_g17267 [Phytophthora rubi]|uniref:Uncharacterized protein n=1 Tax=Phytophthora rubi TaxID=129364 RepID=A0A6A3KR48_9STRA|nr:hypothetical protein PR002_g16646 [Phytophthora rubi]KAE9009389.1 hypothetical protein PR001_g16459 [Phytophthora rubi]KAE9322289.1 hypothetical protein PR003_g17267 [Phytophthora rubi]
MYRVPVNNTEVDSTEPAHVTSDLHLAIDTITSASVSIPPKQKPRRKKFAAVDDVVHLRAVNAFRPWRAPVGTFNGIMKVFEDIAVQCGANPEFGVDKPGAELRARFGTLMKEFKRDQCKSMRKSGTGEQFEERDRLLLDIIAQTDDTNDIIEADNRVKEAKQRSIESSGELMWSLAMNEIDETEGSERGNVLLSPEGRERERKRAAQPGSAQKGKVAKRERPAVVMGALTERLKSSSEEEGNKYDYKP